MIHILNLNVLNELWLNFCIKWMKLNNRLVGLWKCETTGPVGSLFWIGCVLLKVCKGKHFHAIFGAGPWKFCQDKHAYWSWALRIYDQDKHSWSSVLICPGQKPLGRIENYAFEWSVRITVVFKASWLNSVYKFEVNGIIEISYWSNYRHNHTMTTCVISIDRRERVVTQFLQLHTACSVINRFTTSIKTLTGVRMYLR